MECVRATNREHGWTWTLEQVDSDCWAAWVHSCSGEEIAHSAQVHLTPEAAIAEIQAGLVRCAG